MQSFYPERFERDMACTEADWLRWLPRAVGDHPCDLHAGSAQVRIGSGALQLRWRPLPERTIALVRLPRLALQFEFDRVPDVERQVFMQRFDLYTQRGGG